jgi:hypothetical protein
MTPTTATLQAFAQRHGLGADAVRGTGRLTLTVDGRYRVHLQPSTHNRLAFTAQLMPWPAVPDTPSDRTMERLLRTASGMLQANASTLCIDEVRHALLLQQCVPVDAPPATLDDALGEFVNALAFWSKLCTAEAALRH